MTQTLSPVRGLSDIAAGSSFVIASIARQSVFLAFFVSFGYCPPEGKTIVAQNAVKPGLPAQEALVKGEDPGDFALYRDGMPEELAPAGLMEPLLAERTAGLAWRLRRAERLQAAAFDALPEEKKWAWSDKDNKWLVPQEARESGSWERCPCFGEDDVATNVPEAEEPSCETKPIVKGIGARRSGIGRLQQSRQARGFD